MINPSMFINTAIRNSTIIFIAGLASVLFFGLCVIFAFRKLFDKKVGLIINREGITDNSSVVSAGLVLWSDIEEIEICTMAGQKFLMVILKNPQDYINKITSPLKRKAMEMNYKIYGSSISISANLLQTNFGKLRSLLLNKMKEYIDRENERI